MSNNYKLTAISKNHFKEIRINLADAKVSSHPQQFHPTDVCMQLWVVNITFYYTFIVYKHVQVLRKWLHVPKKILKIYTTDIKSESSFDGKL